MTKKSVIFGVMGLLAVLGICLVLNTSEENIDLLETRSRYGPINYEMIEYGDYTLENSNLEDGSIVFNPLKEPNMETYLNFSKMSYDNGGNIHEHIANMPRSMSFPSPSETFSKHTSDLEWLKRQTPNFQIILEFMEDKADDNINGTFVLPQDDTDFAYGIYHHIQSLEIALIAAPNLDTLGASTKAFADFMRKLHETSPSQLGELSMSVSYCYNLLPVYSYEVNGQQIDDKIVENFNYYVYFMNSQVEYLLQFTSAPTLPGEPARYDGTHSVSQDEYRELMISYLQELSATLAEQ